MIFTVYQNEFICGYPVCARAEKIRKSWIHFPPPPSGHPCHIPHVKFQNTDLSHEHGHGGVGVVDRTKPRQQRHNSHT